MKLLFLKDISKLLLKRAKLSIAIIEIDDKLPPPPIDETKLTKDIEDLIIKKNQLEQEKARIDASIEFMQEEIYTEKEKAEMRRNAEAKEKELEEELEEELAALFKKGKNSQSGGKRKTKKRNNKTKKNKTNKGKKGKTNKKKKTQKRKP